MRKRTIKLSQPPDDSACGVDNIPIPEQITYKNLLVLAAARGLDPTYTYIVEELIARQIEFKKGARGA